MLACSMTVIWITLNLFNARFRRAYYEIDCFEMVLNVLSFTEKVFCDHWLFTTKRIYQESL